MMKSEKEITLDSIPVIRSNYGKYKDYVQRFVKSNKIAVDCEYDTAKEAQSMVGFCKSKTGQLLGVGATQRGCHAIIWKEEKRR